MDTIILIIAIVYLTIGFITANNSLKVMDWIGEDMSRVKDYEKFQPLQEDNASRKVIYILTFLFCFFFWPILYIMGAFNNEKDIDDDFTDKGEKDLEDFLNNFK